MSSLSDNFTLVLISGRSGSGKSSVANHLHALLSKEGRPHAAIEADSLDMVYPEVTGPSLFLSNLESVWENIRLHRNCSSQEHARECDLLLLNGSVVALEWRGIVASVRAATLAAATASTTNSAIEKLHEFQISTHIVILHASDEIIRTRLCEREIGSNEAFEAHVAGSTRVARILDDINIDHFGKLSSS